MLSSGVNIKYSSPYHHQANSTAERAVGIVKNLWKKGEDGQDKQTSLWMYRITPIDSNLPSPYKLLFSGKPKTFLPATGRQATNGHCDQERHLEANQQRQDNQAQYYNRRASFDKRKLLPGKPIVI